MAKNTNLGDLISMFYEDFLMRFNGDEELASIATAAVINDIITAAPTAAVAIWE